jgi:hypothetical protein
MIIYWDTLEKNAGDPARLPDYIASNYFSRGFYPAVADRLLALGPSGELPLPAPLAIDVIKEKTAAAGVTIDGLLIKDGKAPALSSKIISATRDMAAEGEDVAYTGVGFMPSSIQVFADIDNSLPSSVGFADSLKTGHSIIHWAPNIHSMVSYFVYIDTTASTIQYAVVKSYDTDGFTLTWTKVGLPTGTMQLRFLCFR